MSTTDPRVERAEKEERRRRSGAGVAVAAIVAVLHLGLWALVGYGFVAVYDSGRLMAVNQVGDGWDSRFDSQLPLAFLVGIFAGSITGVLLSGRMLRLLGGLAGLLAPLVTGFSGAAIGLALAHDEWTPPELVGRFAGFLDGDPEEPWDSGAWIAYGLPDWLPLLLAGLGLLSLAGAVVAASAARRTALRMATAIETGRRVLGAVTEVRSTGTEINGLPLVGVTVRFVDHLSTPRWVTKRARIDPASLPREGDPVVVWFDPEAPGDQKRIVLGFGPEAEAAATAAA